MAAYNADPSVCTMIPKFTRTFSTKISWSAFPLEKKTTARSLFACFCDALARFNANNVQNKHWISGLLRNSDKIQIS